MTDSSSSPLLTGAERGLRVRPGGSFRGTDIWERIRAGFRMPSPDHPAITAEVEWFVRNQGFIDRTTTRARPYLYHIVEQVEAGGIPSEVALLPVVESAFQPFAHSPARASGIWQFIPETGRRFGLRQSWWYDGRRDVLASTRAALEYLTVLQNQFGGDWLLAIAAYNCGEGTVGRAIQDNERRGLPTDFWNLSLPEETRGYVPRLLALARIVKRPEAFGLQLAAIPNKPYITRVALDGPVDLNVAADVAELSLADLRHLNPGFSRWATDPDGPHHLVLPVDKSHGFAERLQALPDHERLPWKRHTVRRGETLAMLASRYGTTPETLQQVNELQDRRLRPGNTVRVPLSPRASGTVVVLDEPEAPAPVRVASRSPSAGSGAARRDRGAELTQKGVTHVVRPGESLYSLARRYGVKPEALAKVNGLSPRVEIKTGQKLTVKADAAPLAIAPATSPSKPVSAKTVDTRIADAAQTAPAKNKNNAPPVARAGKAAQTAGAADAPKPIRYKVKRGETLWNISQRFGVTVAMLQRWNNLGSSQSVQAGQELSVYREDTRLTRAG